jgi:hypothetical protein
VVIISGLACAEAVSAGENSVLMALPPLKSANVVKIGTSPNILPLRHRVRTY